MLQQLFYANKNTLRSKQMQPPGLPTYMSRQFMVLSNNCFGDRHTLTAMPYHYT